MWRKYIIMKFLYQQPSLNAAHDQKKPIKNFARRVYAIKAPFPPKKKYVQSSLNHHNLTLPASHPTIISLSLSLSLSNLLKKRHRATEITPIIRLLHHPFPLPRHHILTRLGTQPPDPDPTTTPDLEHILLARFRLETVLRVIVEETVQTRAINENILGVDDAETPCFFTARASAGAEIRVRVFLLGDEAAGEGIRVGLHVGGFGLDGGHVDVFGVADLVIVELAVLCTCAVKPHAAVTL